jgi:uncharacterized membrane protein YfcA
MIVELICIGIVSGILTGITGLQSAVLFPLLMLIIPDIKTVIGTVMYIYLPPTTILAVYYLYKQKHVDVYKGNILIIVLLFSVLIGSMISTKLSRKTILGIESCILIMISCNYLRLYYKE